MRTLVAGNLRLEPQAAAHAEEMFAVLSDPAIYEYENEPPQSLSGLQERFAELESRKSPNGKELWLNWVVRLPTSQLVGYVQATVYPSNKAAVAYEFASPFWGRGYARTSLQAMFSELAEHYGVRKLSAVLKRENVRSLRLLEWLGFKMASTEECELVQIERDEFLMQRTIRPGLQNAL